MREDLRQLTMNNLDNYGLNPFAVRILIMSYMKNVAPKPVTIDYHLIADDVDNTKILQKAPESEVEITISTPGYLGRETGNVNDLEKRGVRDTCRAYYKYVRPMPISFLFGKAEIHIRSKSVSDTDRKNIARDIWDPREKQKKKKLLQKD